MLPRRPKPGESDEELMKFQREFLSGEVAPSAKLVKKAEKRTAEGETGNTWEGVDKDVVQMQGLPESLPSTSHAPQVKKSRFKQAREKTKVEFEQMDTEDLVEKHDQHITNVLSKIVERDTRDQPVRFPTPMTLGFPSVHHRGTITQTSKKKSIFAQQFETEPKQKFGINTDSVGETVTSSFEQALQEENKKQDSSLMHSKISDFSDEERQKIHEENLSTLKSMSEEQILEEQAQLMKMLDPKLIAFFKNKQKTTKTVPVPQPVPPDDVAMDTNVAQTTQESSDGLKVKKTDKVTTYSQVPAPNLQSLPYKPKAGWVNMNKVEPDKLEWIKDMPPPPKADTSQTGKPARFDFHGNLLATDADIPTHLGLHHHGNEPERAGYTLEELFQLARSANMQQRVVALQTLARVICNAKKGDFSESLSKPLLPSLLEGGVVFLIRWALDDSMDNAMAAAVQALHALLVNGEDEVNIDAVFFWHRGMELPLLSPVVVMETDEDGGEVKGSDADLVRKDVVKGLIHTTLLQRLRYILEVWQPHPTVVKNILAILVRVARHSTEAAYEVFSCPRLLDTIFTNFLPTTWSPTDEPLMTNVYGYPVPGAMRLACVLCTAGRNMAAMLYVAWNAGSNNPELQQEWNKKYTAVDPSTHQLPSKEAYELSVASLKTWRICSGYGLASDQLRDFYPVLIQAVQQISALNLHHHSQSEKINLHLGQVGLLEAMLNIGASAHTIAKNTENRSSQTSDQPSDDGSPPVPAIDWSQVVGLLQPMEMCVQKWLTQFREIYITEKPSTSLLSSVLHFLASFHSHCDKQPGFDAVTSLQRIEELMLNTIQPVLESYAFQVALGRLSTHSPLLTANIFTKEITTSLPSLGSIQVPGTSYLVTDKGSPYHFLTSVFRVLNVLFKLHKGLNKEVLSSILLNGDVISYVKKACCHGKLPECITRRAEDQLLYYMIKLAMIQKPSNIQLYHQAALHLITRLEPGDEHFVHDLLSMVVFDTECFSHESSNEEMALLLEQMRLKDVFTLRSATGQQTVTDPLQLISKAKNNMPAIRATYLETFGRDLKSLQKSRAKSLPIPNDIDSFLRGRLGDPLVPRDWCFLPLVMLYQQTVKLESSGKSVDSLPHSQVSLAINCLQWIFLMECWREDVMSSVSITTRITRLMCVFMTGNDLFLETSVHWYLTALLRKYCHPNRLSRLDFNEDIPGLSSFHDFYISFVNQFSAVSFGDPLFASFVLLPMQQRHSYGFRKAVWGEHSAALRGMRIAVKELLIPVENFLEPEENHLELLRLYLQALLSGTVTQQRAPLCYLIAVHHVNRFIYMQTKHKKLKKMMLRQIGVSRNKDLKHHIFYYKQSNQDHELGFVLYDTLPQSRQTWLQTNNVQDWSESVD